MTNCFILLAAGKGKRFKSNNPKQFTNYINKPLFMHSVDKALKSKLFKSIIIVSNRPIKNIRNKVIFTPYLIYMMSGEWKCLNLIIILVLFV